MRRIAIAVALVLMLATTAHAGEIFRYVTSDGTVSFTDEMSKVPVAYKDTAETVVLEGEFKDFDRLSIITLDPSTGPATFGDYLVASKLANRDFDRAIIACPGHVSTARERVQFGDFNRMVYFTYDECGNLISSTFSLPVVQIGR